MRPKTRSLPHEISLYGAPERSVVGLIFGPETAFTNVPPYFYYCKIQFKYYVCIRRPAATFYLNSLPPL